MYTHYNHIKRYAIIALSIMFLQLTAMEKKEWSLTLKALGGYFEVPENKQEAVRKYFETFNIEFRVKNQPVPIKNVDLSKLIFFNIFTAKKFNYTDNTYAEVNTDHLKEMKLIPKVLPFPLFIGSYQYSVSTNSAFCRRRFKALTKQQSHKEVLTDFILNDQSHIFACQLDKEIKEGVYPEGLEFLFSSTTETEKIVLKKVTIPHPTSQYFSNTQGDTTSNCEIEIPSNIHVTLETMEDLSKLINLYPVTPDKLELWSWYKTKSINELTAILFLINYSNKNQGTKGIGSVPEDIIIAILEEKLTRDRVDLNKRKKIYTLLGEEIKNKLIAEKDSHILIQKKHCDLYEEIKGNCYNKDNEAIYFKIPKDITKYALQTFVDLSCEYIDISKETSEKKPDLINILTYNIENLHRDDLSAIIKIIPSLQPKKELNVLLAKIYTQFMNISNLPENSKIYDNKIIQKNCSEAIQMLNLTDIEKTALKDLTKTPTPIITPAPTPIITPAPTPIITPAPTPIITPAPTPITQTTTNNSYATSLQEFIRSYQRIIVCIGLATSLGLVASYYTSALSLLFKKYSFF